MFSRNSIFNISNHTINKRLFATFDKLFYLLDDRFYFFNIFFTQCKILFADTYKWLNTLFCTIKNRSAQNFKIWIFIFWSNGYLFFTLRCNTTNKITTKISGKFFNNWFNANRFTIFVNLSHSFTSTNSKLFTHIFTKATKLF